MIHRRATIQPTNRLTFGPHLSHSAGRMCGQSWSIVDMFYFYAALSAAWAPRQRRRKRRYRLCRALRSCVTSSYALFIVLPRSWAHEGRTELFPLCERVYPGDRGLKIGRKRCDLPSHAVTLPPRTRAGAGSCSDWLVHDHDTACHVVSCRVLLRRGASCISLGYTKKL